MKISHIRKVNKRRRRAKMDGAALVNVLDNARSKKAVHFINNVPKKQHQADENIKKIQELESRHCSSDEFPLLWDEEE